MLGRKTIKILTSVCISMPTVVLLCIIYPTFTFDPVKDGLMNRLIIQNCIQLGCFNAPDKI